VSWREENYVDVI